MVARHHDFPLGYPRTTGVQDEAVVPKVVEPKPFRMLFRRPGTTPTATQAAGELWSSSDSGNEGAIMGHAWSNPLGRMHEHP